MAKTVKTDENPKKIKKVKKATSEAEENTVEKKAKAAPAMSTKAPQAEKQLEKKKQSATLNKAIEKSPKKKNSKKKLDKNQVKEAVAAGVVKVVPAPLTEAELSAKALAKIERKKVKKLKQKERKLKNKQLGIKEAKPVVKTKKTLENGTKDAKLNAKKTAEGQKAKAKEGKPVPKQLTEEEQQQAELKREAKKAKKQKAKQLSKNLAADGDEEHTNKGPMPQAETIFIGNLPVNTKRVQLEKLCRQYGQVRAIRFRSALGKVLFKAKARKEAGTLNAHVCFKNQTQAKKALELNGTSFKGHHLRVTPLGAKVVQTDNVGDTGYDTKRTIFVGNLKYSATEDKLREIFSSCGEIEYVRCMRSAQNNGCNGVAYVCFKSADAVGLALELKETLLDERPINVERYSLKKQGAKEKRDAEAQAEKVTLKGAKKRLAGKPGGKSSAKAKSDDGEEKPKKKSEFRGVKVDALKKKNKKKKNNQMTQLAKKIAPKPKKNEE